MDAHGKRQMTRENQRWSAKNMWLDRPSQQKSCTAATKCEPHIPPTLTPTKTTTPTAPELQASNDQALRVTMLPLDHAEVDCVHNNSRQEFWLHCIAHRAWLATQQTKGAAAKGAGT